MHARSRTILLQHSHIVLPASRGTPRNSSTLLATGQKLTAVPDTPEMTCTHRKRENAQTMISTTAMHLLHRQNQSKSHSLGLAHDHVPTAVHFAARTGPCRAGSRTATNVRCCQQQAHPSMARKPQRADTATYMRACCTCRNNYIYNTPAHQLMLVVQCQHMASLAEDHSNCLTPHPPTTCLSC